MNPDPKDALLKGVAVLEPALSTHGFKFRLGQVGKGSGGAFASGEFFRKNRVLELHFRQSLGLVTYHIDNESLDHETYLRYLGKWRQHKYPGFSTEPLAAFRDLAHDLEAFCADFVFGTGEEFCKFAQQHAKNPDKFKGLGVG